MSKYTIVWFHGKRVDNYTKQALQAVEKDLGYELTIVQGSYNKGVGASANTHDGGGTVDLAAYDWRRKVKALRKRGFAAWFRPELWIRGRLIWRAHIHAVQIGNAKLHWTAADQVTDYRNHLNGLANNGWDSFWRPKKIQAFQYDGSSKSEGTMVTTKFFSRTKNFRLTRGKAVIPRINNGTGVSFAWEPGDYLLVVEIGANNLPTSKEIQASIIKIKWPTRKVVGGSRLEEIIGTGGASFGTIVKVLNIKKYQRLRLRLQTYSDDVEIRYITSHVVKLK